jgi:hypothetical protein
MPGQMLLRLPRCDAYARSTGKRCKRSAIFGKTKCRNHGGLSTGPKTPEGKARCAAGRRNYWAAYRLAKAIADTAP